MEQKHQICRDIEFFTIFHCYWGFEIFLLKREKTAFVVSVLIRINNASCNLSLFFYIFYFMKSCIAMSGKWYKFRTELFFYESDYACDLLIHVSLLISHYVCTF